MVSVLLCSLKTCPLNPTPLSLHPSCQIAAPVLDQRRKVTEEINNDRQLAVQAALVRIMKSRKKLGHQQLIAEVVTQLQKMFSADVKLVKRSIEQLIDVRGGDGGGWLQLRRQHS